MNINTEAAELLHAVADLYECGALKWVRPGEDSGYVQMSLVLAVICASRELSGDDVMHAAIDATRQEAPTHYFYYWQRRKGRTVKDVIALLRRAAQRLEEA